jgi:MFS family permease
MKEVNRTKLMWVSFLTLVAAGVGFATRASAGGVWEAEFGIGGGDFGKIMGAGFLGFGMMIFFGGILVEKFGYKKLLLLAFFLHLASAVMLILAPGMFEGWKADDATTAGGKVFELLWWSVFLFSICQGLYEAVINPMVAQIYPENQTHYLNILHAGWPAGMIIGGLFSASFIGKDAWVSTMEWQFALSTFAVIVLIYGVIAAMEPFPATVSEKSDGDIGKVFSCFASWPFLLLIVMHGCIGYMELGVDSWVSKLMENLLPNAIIILVYTSFLMFILRFFAGPIVHRINPIGLLLASSVIACVGLLWLGSEIDSLAMIFVAATFYSFGKAFLWPTMLGVAGERYPQSGAVAMGALGAAGCLTVGLLGGARIGAQQGSALTADLEGRSKETYNRYIDTGKDKDQSFLNISYVRINPEKMNAGNGVPLTAEGKVDKEAKGVTFDNGAFTAIPSISDAKLLDEATKKELLANVETDAKNVQDAYLFSGRQALTLTSYIPGIMIVGFLILALYFKSIGGYKVLTIDGKEDVASADDSPDADA